MVLCLVLAGCNLTNPENSLPTTDPTTDDNVWDPNMVDIGITVGEEGDEVVEDACYLYTPQIVDDTFRYLDEIYTNRYPEMALRWDRGVTADMRIFTAFAQQLTKGCTTDREKVSAIYDWITANIEYNANCSPMSVDVLYNGHGSCLGQVIEILGSAAEILGRIGSITKSKKPTFVKLDSFSHGLCIQYGNHDP